MSDDKICDLKFTPLESGMIICERRVRKSDVWKKSIYYTPDILMDMLSDWEKDPEGHGFTIAEIEEARLAAEMAREIEEKD